MDARKTIRATITHMRRALVIGINYAGTDAHLSGCVNDAMNMERLLHDRGYVVKVLRDDDRCAMPTAARIVRELSRIVAWTHGEAGREIVVHYSGHGAQMRDRSGDELDGQDELILPCDYRICGAISDDTLRLVVQGISSTARAFFIFDACHSGTILDMAHVLGAAPHVCGTMQSDAEVHMLSGCRDDQTSADAFNLQHQGNWAGALTWALLRNAEAFDTGDVHLIVERIRRDLKDARFAQIPQWSCTKSLKGSRMNLLSRE